MGPEVSSATVRWPTTPGRAPFSCGPDRDDEIAAKEYSPPTPQSLPDADAAGQTDGLAPGEPRSGRHPAGPAARSRSPWCPCWRDWRLPSSWDAAPASAGGVTIVFDATSEVLEGN